MNFPNPPSPEKRACMECICHGFYCIINNIKPLKNVADSNQLNKFHYQLALSGTADVKNVAKYENHDQLATSKLVKILDINERYRQVLDVSAPESEYTCNIT